MKLAIVRPVIDAKDLPSPAAISPAGVHPLGVMANAVHFWWNQASCFTCAMFVVTFFVLFILDRSRSNFEMWLADRLDMIPCHRVRGVFFPQGIL